MQCPEDLALKCSSLLVSTSLHCAVCIEFNTVCFTLLYAEVMTQGVLILVQAYDKEWDGCEGFQNVQSGSIVAIILGRQRRISYGAQWISD